MGNDNRKKESLRIPVWMIAALLAAICTLCLPLSAGAATYTQKKPALAPYTVSSYKTVKNTHYVIPDHAYEYYSSDVMKSQKGYRTTFTRSMSTLMLTSGGTPMDPQSMAITPDGRYLYIVYLIDHGGVNNLNARGRLVRFDLNALRQDNGGQIPDQVNSKDTRYVKTGPLIVFGHCQSLAYNPKTKSLWFVAKPGYSKTCVKELDMNTFRVKNTVNYSLKSTVSMGYTLAFDKRGNAYFYTSSKNGTWSPKRSIKIYKGTVSRRSVRWHLVMQGIRYANGPIRSGNNIIQGMGYNPKLDRLYFVSDSSILSVPAGKLGRLKPSDVRESVFGGHREFEGVAFDGQGRGLLLTNRPYEVMRTGDGF